MSEHQLPDCFCQNEAMSSCKWVFEMTGRYYHRKPDGSADDDSVKSTVPWTLENIPQPLAQLLLQTMVKAVNEQGLDVYAAWLSGCFGEDSEEVQYFSKARQQLGV